MYKKKNILYPELSYKLTGLLYKTHNDLGKYKNEKQYGDYFEKLLIQKNINFKRECPLNMEKHKDVRCYVDFLIERV